MKKNSLSTSGLSLSQAQSISNLCHQRATEINHQLTNVNNYSKVVEVGKKDHVIVAAKPLPTNVVALLTEKAKLHACQAFLMENIKAKTELLVSIKTSKPDLSNITQPKAPEFVRAEVLPEVYDNYGWEQLTVSELGEYLEAEAYASHIGQFIHKGSTLDVLRNELPRLPAIEWMTIKDGEKSPVEIKVHHKSSDLLKLHEELAALHRGFEQKVNYFKAKVNNLVTAENARIANINADAESKAEKTNYDLRTEYDLAVKKMSAEQQAIKVEFEKERQSKIKTVAALRIDVNPRFQEVVDIFLKQLPENQD